MEPQLVCPNCRAENLPGALTCYRCNAKLAGAPGWVGPMTFKTYDASRDRGIAYLLAALGGVVVLVGYFLAWVGIPVGLPEAQNRGISAVDILLASTESFSAIDTGGILENSIALDVRLVLFVCLVAAVVGAISALVKPMFGAILTAGIVTILGPIYFLLQLVFRNKDQFNTPDLLSLLRWGFYITLVGGLLMIGTSFRYRKVPTMQSR